MIQRCCNPNNPGYKDYGGQGVTVCDAWKNSFEAFLADMGERPPGKTLDRVNGAKTYAPGNCRWATTQEQSDNRKNVRLYPYLGQMKTAAAWARELPISRTTLYRKLSAGLTIAQALEIA